MVHQTDLVIGVSVGLAIGVLIALCAYIGIRWYKKHSNVRRCSNDRNITTLPIRTNGLGASIDSSASLSNSITMPVPQHLPESTQGFRWNHHSKDQFASTSGILRYLYKDIQKATQNFTTILGQGSFGPVYKATIPAGGVAAVKVLAANSKQGEKEFQTEVLLLGEGEQVLSWDERLQIALDISHGIEYLHDGAVPPVIHRDLKSANILLDQSMRAKVADFGLSKEEAFDGRNSGLKGTYGYIDPEYISTNKFTKKSDLYSLGIILFELITAIHPHQNLMEYINMAAMSPDGVDEILDKKLVGKCNPEEVRLLASIGHKCLHKTPRRRPSIGDVSQAILKIKKRRLSKQDTLSFAFSEVAPVVRRIEHQQVELTKLTSMNIGVQEQVTNPKLAL